MDAGGNASLTYTAPKQPKKQSKCKPIVDLLNVCVSLCTCVCVHTSMCVNMVRYSICVAAQDSHHMLAAAAVDAQKQ